MTGTWISTRGWLLMLPLLVVMTAVIGWPLVDTVRLSFTDAKLVGTEGGFVGTANYIKMLGGSNFQRALVTRPGSQSFRLPPKWCSVSLPRSFSTSNSAGERRFVH